MAYFLPSYFQKRLLRYALTRLDLIDTDAIDLDDLDITLGQQSVIELKNVGIRVEKLIQKLNIPSTIVLKRAIIKQLRLTIPADLHVSGINVVVDGVEIDVQVQEQEVVNNRSASSPSHKDVGNRPRLTSPSIHDPGGDGHDHGLDHVLPTSEDLAHSFLEAEPRQEKAQLEAALQSQSLHMSESSTSLEEAGLGNPGGFSLPTFVADFFAGVANRLNVSIANVEVVAGLFLASSPLPREDAKVMLRLAQISLSGTETNQSSYGKRRIEISGIEVLLLSEREAFSQHSTSGSPRLSKSRSKPSSTIGSGSFSQFESPEQRSTIIRPEHPATSDRAPSELDLSPHASLSSASFSPHAASENSLLIGSQLFRSSGGNDHAATSFLNSDSGQQSKLDDLSPSSGSPDTPLARSKSSLDEHEDLSESKLFTHEEAESMYLSAVSHGLASSAMPGGWAADVDSEVQSKTSLPSRVEPTPTLETSHKHDLPLHDSDDEQTPVNQSQPSITESSADEQLPLVKKRLIEVDKIVLTLPLSASSFRDASSQPEGIVKTSESTRSEAASIYHSTYGERRVPKVEVGMGDSSTGSALFQSTHAKLSSRDFLADQEYEYTMLVGSITCHLDMSIARILVQTSSVVRKLFPPSSAHTDTGHQSPRPFSLQTQITSVQIMLCQSVAEVLDRMSNQNPVICLLQLSLTKISCEVVQENTELQQKVTVNKIVLGQADEKVLYFMDSMNVQNSIATSMMIRPHDLVILSINNRLDVQFKPLHIVLDLLLVDDILSRGGGLDSLLDLAASTVSTGTVKEPPAKAFAGSKQRSVRFDHEQATPVKSQTATEVGRKIDVRISGAYLDLVGSEASLQLKTTAVKLVSRSNKAKVQIDKAVLIGPLVHGSQSAADINIRVDNTTLLYLDTPAEEDLERLLSLLTPSSDKYEEEDDIMVPTLIRQRKKGGVLRLSTTDVQVHVRGITWQKHLTRIVDELSRLSAVSKYLPEDDRPGVLTFAMINKVGIKVDMGRPFGILQLNSYLLEGALITVPSLMAAQVSRLSLKRGEDTLMAEVIPNSQENVVMGPPMLMCRFIADEMEPTVRVKLSNAQLEYKVSLVIAMTDLLQSIQTDMASENASPASISREESQSTSELSDLTRNIHFSLTIRNSTIGLNPTGLPSKGIFLLTDASLKYAKGPGKKNEATIRLDLRKASILIINDVERLGHEMQNVDHKLYFEENDQVQDLTKAGYVPVGSISNASANIILHEEKSTNTSVVDVEFRNNLFLLETCADSTQTLIQVLSGLSPPAKPSPSVEYRMEIVPIQDMLSSFTGNAFVTEPGPELGLQASQTTSIASRSTRDSIERESDLSDGEQDYDYDEYDEDRDDDDEDDDDDDDANENTYDHDPSYSQDGDHSDAGALDDSYIDSEMSHSTMTGSIHVAPVNLTADDHSGTADSIMAHSMLDFRTDHFVQRSSVGGTAHRWDSARNTYELGSETAINTSPLKVRMRDVHVIWNLFDGYDWQSTRDTISKAVEDIESKAMSKKARRESSRSPSAEEDEAVIGDFLFNSIYIGIPANRDPKELTNAINQEIDDMVSETGSYATGTTVTAVPSGRTPMPRTQKKKLRLNRSKQHKMTFELSGVSADVLVFPPDSGEVQSSVDVRVKMLEIFDHVPTSTWKKFATYMDEAGEREVDTSMIHLELLNVKPIADLSASEIVLKLTILPLRLHVDQDALDFMTRFFEFKDDSVSTPSPSSVPPFIQRAEVNPVKLRLDYKPKRVDYAALRSGRTGEFKNFFTLDRSNMVLRRVILYGVSGFDRLGLMLNDIWSPDVQRNQLSGVLAGLAPIRSLVDVGSGVRDLVAVPIREYKKDGRIVRSIQKGALAFAKTTTTELVNLGAKLALGTQTVLQGAEGMLVPRAHNEDDETTERISLYADQPLGIVQGLRGAYASLERDLLLAKDAIVAVPGEVMASESATAAAKAVLKQSPTIILRPAIGASKAVGQTLLGAGNALDKRNRKRMEDKYKRH